MNCKNCGKEIEEDSNFCPYCGFKLIKNQDEENLKKKANNTKIVENKKDIKILENIFTVISEWILPLLILIFLAFVFKKMF